MKLLVGVFFIVQLHGMEVFDQINQEYTDAGIAILYVNTLNVTPDFKKLTYLNDVQKRHIPTGEDKEISPRSTKNILKYNTVGSKNGVVSLKNFTVKSSEDLKPKN